MASVMLAANERELVSIHTRRFHANADFAGAGRLGRYILNAKVLRTSKRMQSHNSWHGNSLRADS
jgi:hypothetical protein